MKVRRPHVEATRRAILDALAQVIVGAKGVGFSVQEVADLAGVTHRTVYNHFPTRDALSEGLAEHVEHRMAQGGPVPDADVTVSDFPRITAELYRIAAMEEVHVRAYVMLMMANRCPAKLTRARQRRFETLIARETCPPGLTERHVTAALRMFVSSLGWHSLTEHLGLSNEDAIITATWATQTLIEKLGPKPEKKGGTRAKGKRRG